VEAASACSPELPLGTRSTQAVRSGVQASAVGRKCDTVSDFDLPLVYGSPAAHELHSRTL